MNRFALSTLIAPALLAAASAAAGQGQLDFKLREIALARPLSVPAPLFREDAKVDSLCQANSVRAPLVDRANRSYLRDADVQKVMAPGRDIADASYQWAYAMAYNLLLQQPQQQQQLSPGQRADVAYNVATLNDVMAQLELTELRYYTSIHALELGVLNEIERAALPAADVLALLQRVDLFIEDNKVCSSRQTGRDRPPQELRRQGWPYQNFPHTRSPDWNAVYAEKGQAQVAFNKAYERLALKAFHEVYPGVLARMKEAKTVDALNAYVQSVFGKGRLFHTLSRRVEALPLAISDTTVAINNAPFTERKQKRLAAKLKTNGSPEADDIMALIMPASMAATVASFPPATGEPKHSSGYTLSVEFGGSYKIMEVDLGIGDLKCKAVGRTQSCSYTEHFTWTEYKLMEKMVLPRGTTSEERSGIFEWTTNGLQRVAGKGPTISYIVRTSRSGGGGGSSDNGGRRERTFADEAVERERDNRREFDSRPRSNMEQYDPQKRY